MPPFGILLLNYRNRRISALLHPSRERVDDVRLFVLCIKPLEPSSTPGERWKARAVRKALFQCGKWLILYIRIIRSGFLGFPHVFLLGTVVNPTVDPGPSCSDAPRAPCGSGPGRGSGSPSTGGSSRWNSGDVLPASLQQSQGLQCSKSSD